MASPQAGLTVKEESGENFANIAHRLSTEISSINIGSVTPPPDDHLPQFCMM